MGGLISAEQHGGQIERRIIRVRGVVQGVGFRPFVFRLARDLDLSGLVRNDAEGVEIEAQGLAGNISALLARLYGEAPMLARVDSVDSALVEVDPLDRGFTIGSSKGGPVNTIIGHDSTVCRDCLVELFDPSNRRWRHPFINCTQCGPRYTLTRALPYDRSTTSMADFQQCLACQEEYDTPPNRRFHAEPNACPECGPSLALYEAAGVRVATRDPIADVLLRLLTGEIVAIKGLGGFHLACDARNPEAVERLRALKGRGAKPFAVMVANRASARRWARLSLPEELALDSAERPIVVCEKRPSADYELWGVAPELAGIGLMLPSSPVHYLLFHDNAGRPAGPHWLDVEQDLALVMTSANPGGEPLLIDNAETMRRLAGIADAYLIHDRNIVVRCDDSLVIAAPGAPATTEPRLHFLRRARGYTPRTIRLDCKMPPVLGLGAYLKSTVCLTRGDEAFLSQHIGDLDNPSTRHSLEEAIEHLQTIVAVSPEAIAHDLNPDFHSTQVALAMADRFGIPAVAVQHHHAHIAAVLAEHACPTAVLGLALDGYGFGTDGAAWGGELLRVDGAGFERVGHLSALPMPGGDAAAREPWRMAASVMHQLGAGDRIAGRFSGQPAAPMLASVLDKPHLCPASTSLGRVFDAAAGLLGVCEVMSYEGEAAMRLESLSSRYGAALAVPVGWRADSHAGGIDLDLMPLLASLVDERNPARGAAAFHATLLAALEAWVVQASRRYGIRTVVLAGGCFANRQLAFSLPRRLAGRGLTVLAARQAPCNDGAISLGQAWVAGRHLLGGA